MTSPVIPVSSPELYKAYVAWRDQDVEDDSREAYRKRFRGLTCWVRYSHATDEVNKEFDRQVEIAFPGNIAYPFGGAVEYMDRGVDGGLHLSPARIKWVNDRIADYEKANQL